MTYEEGETELEYYRAYPRKGSDPIFEWWKQDYKSVEEAEEEYKKAWEEKDRQNKLPTSTRIKIQNQTGILGNLGGKGLLLVMGGTAFFLVGLKKKWFSAGDIVPPLISSTFHAFGNMGSSFLQASSANPVMGVASTLIITNFCKRLGIIGPMTESVIFAGVLGMTGARAISEIIDDILPFDFEKEAGEVPQVVQFDVSDNTPFQTPLRYLPRPSE